MRTPLPVTGSHEGAGTVVAIGSKVTTFKPGDRVMCPIIYHPCGTCADCRGPDTFTQYCTEASYYGLKAVDGYFAEYARVDGRWAVRIPENVSFETAAPLACAGCTVYKSILVAGLERGEWLGIVGSGGGLGHLGVQFAKALGLRVVGVDARDEGLELTRKCGADLVLDVRRGDEELVEEVHKMTNGKGVAATVNVSEAVTATATSCRITRMHGTVVQIAQVCMLDVDIPSHMKYGSNSLQPENVTIPFREIIFRDIRVRGSLICSAQEAQDMLRVVSEHNISVNTNVFKGLGEMEKLIEFAESGKMKGKGIIIIDQAQVDAEGKGLL